MSVPYKIYVCGGAVRDTLLNRPIKDKDYVVVGATEQDMVNAGLKRVGADFPVFINDTGEQFALARTEQKQGHGYKGFQVQFDASVTLEQDLGRRDLSINALAVSVDDWTRFIETKDTSLVIDYYRGLDDLESGILKHISHAFGDDPLRVLRVARFKSRYNFSIAKSTLNFMQQLAESGELNYLTPERIWQEVDSALAENYAHEFFVALRQCKAFDVLFPELRNGCTDSFSLQTVVTRRRLTTEQRFAVFCNRCDYDQINSLLIRLKASNTYTNIVLKGLTLIQQLDSIDTINFAGWSVDQIFKMLDSVNAWRDPNTIIEIADIIQYVCNDRCNRLTTELIQALDFCSQFTFRHLDSEQKQTLRGPQIAQAIVNMRKYKIKEQWNL